MADVSISSLTQGIPAGNSILPYSTGSSTLGAPISAIFQTVSDNLFINTSPISIPGKGIVLSSNDSAGTSLFLNNQTINKSWRIVSTGSNNTGGGSRFGIVNHTDDANNYKLVILSGGEVGIGTGSPSTKLDVNGTIKATGLNAPGCVVQVSMATFGDKATYTDTTQYVNFFSTNFTPKFSTSKVFIQSIFYVAGGGGIRIRRGIQPIFEPISNGGASPYQFWSGLGTSIDGGTMRNGYSINWLDAPGTNSQITYNFDARAYPGSFGLGFNQNNFGTTGAPCTVTFMEIAG